MTTDAEQVFRGTLAPLLALADEHPNATELCIDGPMAKLNLGNEWLCLDDLLGLKPKHIEAAAYAAASFANKQFGQHHPQKPRFSVKIPPDLRVSVICPPASESWDMSIRFLRCRALTLEDYVAAGIMTSSQALELRLLLSARKNLIISGGTGSGKTTLLRCLLELVRHERLIIIEDTPELSVEGARHWATVEDNTDMSDLLKQALRMAPDRIVVGEVRGPEALEMVRAMNTGHSGTLGTLHSNGCEDCLDRLQTLVSEGQPTYPVEGIRRAIDYVVQLTGQGQARLLSSIWKVPRE